MRQCFFPEYDQPHESQTNKDIVETIHRKGLGEGPGKLTRFFIAKTFFFLLQRLSFLDRIWINEFFWGGGTVVRFFSQLQVRIQTTQAFWPFHFYPILAFRSFHFLPNLGFLTIQFLTQFRLLGHFIFTQFRLFGLLLFNQCRLFSQFIFTQIRLLGHFIFYPIQAFWSFNFYPFQVLLTVTMIIPLTNLPATITTTSLRSR